jgi:hypothetical protein
VSDANTLLTIAQLAVGLIGVSAIVSVFLSQGDLHPFDRWRFAMIVLNGMLVAFAAFVPIWTGYFLSEPDRMWRIASVVSIVAGLVLMIPSVRWGRSVVVPPGPTARRGYMYALPMLAAIYFGLGISNSLGWPLSPNQFLYEAALFTSLVQVAIYFVDLTIFRPT